MVLMVISFKTCNVGQLQQCNIARRKADLMQKYDHLTYRKNVTVHELL